MKSEQQLAIDLLKLPMDLQDKVLLWLTYKGLKPVSEICPLKRDKLYLKLRLLFPKLSKFYPHQKYNFESLNSLKIRKWIKDSGLNFLTTSATDPDWYIGHDKKKIAQTMASIYKPDIKSQTLTGKLLGFPENSAIAYSKILHKPYSEIKKHMVGTGADRFENPFLKDKYYTPYILYNIPKNKIEEDSQTAKIWADTIRHDVPSLAKAFEKSQQPKN